MGKKRDAASSDDRARRVADTQLGLITRAQALECGLTDKQIKHRLDSRRWTRPASGIYLVHGTEPSFEQRALAGVLYCGPGAVVSGEAAAVLWGFLERCDGDIEIAIPAGRSVRLPGFRVHRSTLLRPHERSRRSGIAVTGASRTLLRLAETATRALLEQAADAAFRSRFITPDRLIDYLDDPALKRMPGRAQLRALAVDRRQFGIPETALETLATQVIKDWRLPEPVRQHWITLPGRRVRADLAYPDRKIAIELDGRDPRADPKKFDDDRERQHELERAGWVVLRFTWRQLNQRPDYVAYTIAFALRIRPTGWRPWQPRPTRGRGT